MRAEPPCRGRGRGAGPGGPGGTRSWSLGAAQVADGQVARPAVEATSRFPDGAASASPGALRTAGFAQLRVGMCCLSTVSRSHSSEPGVSRFRPDRDSRDLPEGSGSGNRAAGCASTRPRGGSVAARSEWGGHCAGVRDTGNLARRRGPSGRGGACEKCHTAGRAGGGRGQRPSRAARRSERASPAGTLHLPAPSPRVPTDPHQTLASSTCMHPVRRLSP